MSTKGTHLTATDSRFHRIFVMYISSRYSLIEVKLNPPLQINPGNGGITGDSKYLIKI